MKTKNGKVVGSQQGRAVCDPDIEKLVKTWILRDLACINLVSIRKRAQPKIRSKWSYG